MDKSRERLRCVSQKLEDINIEVYCSPEIIDCGCL